MKEFDTWKIMQVVKEYNKKANCIEDNSKERKELDKLYAQALYIQCTSRYGLVMATDCFIATVAGGNFVDYDGCGVFLDFDGNEHEHTKCDVKYLEKYKDIYPFVMWFNK